MDFSITVLVRKEEQAKKLKELGAEVVIGTLDNSDLLKQEASKANVVINAADVDHLGCAKAIIEGLNLTAKQGGKPFLLHTSGTDVLANHKEPIGEQSSKVWTEAELGDINGIEKDRNHRAVDIEVLKAGESGTIDIAIICPPLIYGVGSGPFNTHSIQLPGLIQGAIVNKQAYHAGRGLNVWTHIHVLDLADLFLLVLEKHLQGQAPVNRDGYYFAEAGEHNFLELTDEIAKVLHQKGVCQSQVEGCSKRTKQSSEQRRYPSYRLYLEMQD
jgi:nucleoside-diphosphate-sugar epimerase